MLDDRESASVEGLRFWSLTGLFLGVISALKGLRLPGAWAGTQAQIDYSFGFVKRGLFGQVLHLLHIPAGHYWAFTTCALLLLALLAVVLLAWTWRSGHRRAFDDGIIAAAFLSSFAVSLFCNAVGYLDIPLAILAIGVLSVPWTAAAALIALLIGILIHEMYAVVFLPLTLLPLLFDAADQRDPKLARRRIIQIVLILFMSIAGVFIVSFRRPLAPEQLDALIQRIRSQADFPLREDFFEVFRRSAVANIKIQIGLATHVLWWMHHFFCQLVFVPIALLLLNVSWHGIAMRFDGRRKQLLMLATAVATFAPLGMCALGWDIYRWYMLVVFDAFLVSTIVSQKCLARGQRQIVPSVGRRKIAIVIICVNMATSVGLFDGYHIKSFPFPDSPAFLRDLIQGHPRTPFR